MQALAFVEEWAAAHPTLVAIILIPLVTAVFNLLFKPKTPEQYEKIARVSPRLAAFLQLMGALGVDPVKATQIVTKKLLPGAKGDPPLRGPSALPVLVLASALSLMGCGFLQSHGPELIDALAKRTKCALENMNLPNEEIIARCAIQPEDIDRILPLIGVAREEAAKEALGAREDERAKLGAASCGDAGAK